MNVIDEWLDSVGAERDALKFKNGCYISGRRCGKTAFALSQIEQYLKDHPYAKIAIPYYHNGHYYHKELINSVYGRKKSRHDDTLYAASELIDAIDKYRKEEEEMAEHRVEPGTVIVCNSDNSHRRDGFWVIGDKADEFGHTGFWAYKIPDRMVPDFMALPKMLRVVNMDCNNWFDIKLCYLSNGDSDDIPGWHYATRKEMEEAEDELSHKFTCNVKTALGTIVRLKFIRNKIDPGVAYTVFVHYNPLGEPDHALNYKTWEELSSRLMYDVCGLIKCSFDPLAVDCFSEVLHKAKRVVKYCYCESKENNEEKTVKETTEMKLFASIDRDFIKNVVFHDPATIVEWKDGTKTVVQVRDGEKFDPEKGLAMAISKKAMGNKRDYYHVFKHYLKKVPEQVSVCGEKVKTLTIPEELADDVMQFLKEKAGEKEKKEEKNET